MVRIKDQLLSYYLVHTYLSIAGVDVDVLEANLESTEECGILQETLSGIAFCNPLVEFPEIAPMPIEMLKVFRIAQLTVRYLLRSQDMLTQALTQLTQDNQRAHGVIDFSIFADKLDHFLYSFYSTSGIGKGVEKMHSVSTTNQGLESGVQKTEAND